MIREIIKQTEKCINCGKNPKAGPDPVYNSHEIAKQLREYTENELLPSIDGFCTQHKEPDGKRIRPKTFYNLAAKCQELAEAFEEMQTKSRANIMRGGLTKAFDPHFAFKAMTQQKLMGEDTWEDKIKQDDPIARQEIDELRHQVRQWILTPTKSRRKKKKSA